MQTFLYLPVLRERRSASSSSALARRHGLDVADDQALPADVGADQRGVDMHDLALGDPRLEAGRTVRSKIRRKRSAPQRWRMRVRLEWSGSASCRP